MSRCLVRFICLVLAVAMPFLLCADALASISYTDAEAPEFYVNAYAMNVYDKPSTKSKVREIVPFARNVKRVMVKKGWAKVYTVNRVLGYCKDSLLTEKNPNTLDITLYCQPSKIDVFRRPDINSSVLGHLYRNEPIHVVAMTPLGDWLRIERNDFYGYVQRPRMDTKPYAEGRRAWCQGETMTVYYDYRYDTQLATMYFGQEVTLLEKRGSWAKIRSSSDLIGFCHLSDITTTNPNNINTVVYTQADGNFMFRSSTDLSGRIQVGKDVPLMLLAVDERGFWARVQYGEDFYYIPYVFLGPDKRGKSYKQIVTTAGINIREGTKNSSAIVVTVPTGTRLWLVDATDNRAKVATLADDKGNYYIGFAELQYLK